jgi:hypothetical protein
LDGRPTEVTGKQGVQSLGWSINQRKQAQRIADLPRDDVEAAIESPSPPTLTDLDRRARANPAAMRATTSLLGEAKSFAAFCRKNDPADLIPALAEHEKTALMAHAQIIVDWLAKLAKEIGK